MNCGLEGEPEVAFREGRNKKENMRKLQLAILAAALAGAVSASATLVYNTGVGTSGSADTHWQITATTVGVGLPGVPFNPIITDNTIPGSWLANSADSKWISPVSINGLSPNSGNSIGYYTYEQSFYVDASLVGATLSGRWSSDNAGWAGISLNGGGWVDGNTDLYAFETWHPFTAGTLVAGLNTIDFQLWDGYTPPGGDNGPGGYTGLRVEFNAVPEPTTMLAGALLLLPFGASTLRISRKSRAA